MENQPTSRKVDLSKGQPIDQPTILSQLPVTTPEMPTKQPGKNWEKIILIFLIVAAVFCGGVFIFALTKEKTTAAPEQTQISDSTAHWKTFTYDVASFKYPGNWYQGNAFGEGNEMGGAYTVSFANYPNTDNDSSKNSSKEDFVALGFGYYFTGNVTPGKNEFNNFIQSIPVGTEKTNDGNKITYTREPDVTHNNITFTRYSLISNQSSKYYETDAVVKKNDDYYSIFLRAGSQKELEKNLPIFNQALSTFIVLDEKVSRTPTSPTPTPYATTNWKIYENKRLHFSFSYPPTISYESSCFADACGLFRDAAKNVVISMTFMNDQQGGYCDESGSTIDLQTTPAPTNILKAAEAEARCGCSASGPSGNEACSAASGEEVLGSTPERPTGVRFFLQQDSQTYKNNTWVTSKKGIFGPYVAYFFPKNISLPDDKTFIYSGISFKLEDKNYQNIFDPITQSFKLTN